MRSADPFGVDKLEGEADPPPPLNPNRNKKLQRNATKVPARSTRASITQRDLCTLKPTAPRCRTMWQFAAAVRLFKV